VKVPLRIATYNIHRAIGRDGREDCGRIARVLEEISADIVVLQEVGFRADEADNTLHELARRAGAEAIEGVTLQDQRGHYGNAVLTRLPAGRVRLHDISIAGREPRGAIELNSRVDGVDIHLVATHLGLRPRERRCQVQRLLPLFEGGAGRVDILLGDLNEWFLYGRPLQRLHRLFGALPAPATFPARWPVIALDRFWARPRTLVKSLRVHSSPLARVASDHLPLVAELEIGQPEWSGRRFSGV
jgi:endonuclease/exonuclease/phosphatase family metal-dependent hydrolase